MNPQEQQMIDSLFQRLTQAAPQAGPRDPEAEALIQQHFQSLPGAAYYMAQTLLVQERALQQAEARLAAGGGAGGSFMPPPPAPAYGQPYQPPYQQQQPYPYAAPQQHGAGVGGFLAGAGKIALGVGGGVLLADAVMGLGHDLFGGGGYQQQGFDYDGQYRDRDDGGFVPQQEDFVQQDDSSNDWGGGSDDGGGGSPDW
jgi:uncharacterized protein